MHGDDMKNNKMFALFLMLAAGAVSSIVMYYKHYEMKQMLIILLCVLIFFYLTGYLIQKKVLQFMEQIKEAEEKEGEVIEKELPGDDNDNAEAENTEEDKD